MKVRTGFVSNSSSSSFCIFGSEVPDFKFKDISVDEVCKAYPEMERSQVEELVEYLKDDAYYEYFEAFGLRYYPETDDGAVIGISPADFRDDETGKQFKERIANMISAVVGKKVTIKLRSGEYAC